MNVCKSVTGLRSSARLGLSLQDRAAAPRMEDGSWLLNQPLRVGVSPAQEATMIAKTNHVRTAFYFEEEKHTGNAAMKPRQLAVDVKSRWGREIFGGGSRLQIKTSQV